MKPTCCDCAVEFDPRADIGRPFDRCPSCRTVEYTCEHCGKTGRAAPHRRKRFCDRSCAAKHTRPIQVEAKRWPGKDPWPEIRVAFSLCRVCATPIVSQRYHAYCSSDCTNLHSNHGPAVHDLLTCQACNTTWRRWERPKRWAHCSDACATRAAKAQAKVSKRQRARLQHLALVEPIHRAKVYERDNWCCQLCGDLVDREAQVPDPMAPTIDHILPLALGGEHAYRNVQAAHFICNSRKGAKVEGQLAFAA